MKKEHEENQSDKKDDAHETNGVEKKEPSNSPTERGENDDAKKKEEGNGNEKGIEDVTEKEKEADRASMGGEDPPSENPFLKLIKRNKMASLFAFLLLVVAIWLLVLNNNQRKQHQRDTALLMQEHAAQIDSMRVSHLEFSSRVFSWSVRSELIRNNTENLNQLFTVFVQESEASLVQLITPEGEGDGMKITISTDKQFEGRRFDAPNIPGFTKQHIQEDETGVTIYTPVMEFNRAIGVLLVRLRR